MSLDRPIIALVAAGLCCVLSVGCAQRAGSRSSVNRSPSSAPRPAQGLEELEQHGTRVSTPNEKRRVLGHKFLALSDSLGRAYEGSVVTTYADHEKRPVVWLRDFYDGLVFTQYAVESTEAAAAMVASSGGVDDAAPGEDYVHHVRVRGRSGLAWEKVSNLAVRRNDGTMIRVNEENSTIVWSDGPYIFSIVSDELVGIGDLVRVAASGRYVGE